MTDRDREHLLDLVAALRAEMISKLDALAAAIQAGAAQQVQQKAPSKRRAPLRPPYQGTVAPSDIDRQKARAALRRMGLA